MNRITMDMTTIDLHLFLKISGSIMIAFQPPSSDSSIAMGCKPRERLGTWNLLGLHNSLWYLDYWVASRSGKD